MWFCGAPLCPFPGATAKVGPALHSMADFLCQIAQVSVFSALNKDLFLSYQLGVIPLRTGTNVVCLAHIPLLPSVSTQ